MKPLLHKIDLTKGFQLEIIEMLLHKKPNQLFEYYGDGERPVIGLFPKQADGDEEQTKEVTQ